MTVANAMRIGQPLQHARRGARALGMEDDSTWRVFGKNAPTHPDLPALSPAIDRNSSAMAN